MPINTLRRRIGRVLFDGGLSGLSYLGRMHPRARPERHGLQVLRDLPYHESGERHHHLDVYKPVAPLSDDEHDGSFLRYGPPHPVVLYIHGGAFRILSKDTHWIMGLAFARRGFLAFNINYRLAPKHPFPAALQDACAALEYVVKEAPRYGGDPSRLVIAGESAGANLAMALSLLTVVRREEPWAQRIYDLGVVPKVVVPMCGILQVSDTERFTSRKRLPAWIADRLHETREAYIGERGAHPSRLLADPLVILEEMAQEAAGGPRSASLGSERRPLPPVFASVGTRDPLLDDTRRLEQALKRLGVPHRVVYYPGELHAFQALVFRQHAKQHWQETYAFLDEHLRR